MAALPADLDVLMIDEIGKQISGAGMDTNVINREITGYSTSLVQEGARSPQVHRILVRELTPATKGNGIGLGMADFTTTRLVKSLNLPHTYLNSLTSISMSTAKIPIHFDADREAIQVALESLASENPSMLRVVRILNTLSLDRMQVSESCLGAMTKYPEASQASPAQEMQFDEAGNLLPL